MNSQAFSEWLASLPLRRIRALALMDSSLTVSSRELFLPGWAKGREQIVLDMVHEVNELHHTLANFLLRYAYPRRRLAASGLEPTTAGNRERIPHTARPDIRG